MSPLHHPFAAPPAGGDMLTVAPGIRWLRMPLPFQLDHINLWLLEDGDGWTLVDTGFANDATRDLWQRIFDTGLEGRPITRVVVTHFHPDHMGLAGWHCERWGTDLCMTLGEWLFGRMLSQDHSQAFLDNQLEFHRRAGFDAAQLDVIRRRGNIYSTRVSAIPASFRRLMGGDQLTIGGRVWQAIIGRGHAPEHLCLFCPELGVMISGDQILPKITPIVGVWPQEPDADPLGLYIAALDAFRPLPADTLVLPSHGLPFTGLAARLAQLDHHHEQRLDQTLAACASPATATDLVKVLFGHRALDDLQFAFATGESLAHLNHLIGSGQLTRTARADGVWLYCRA